MDEHYEVLLRRLALLDERTIAAVVTMQADHPGLEPRTAALVRLAGLVALASSPQTYEWAVAAALDTGCSEDEVVSVLAALAPVVGAARVSGAAVHVATAIGCDLEVPGRD